jgi:hypothetical protein
MTSMLTGINHTRLYEMTREQIAAYTSEKRPLIQEIFPELNDEEREFLMTGITPEEWNITFPSEEADNG